MYEEASLDKIHIRDLRCRCIVGVYKEERYRKRDVIVNITLHHKPVEHDSMLLDYDAISKQVLEYVQNSCFQLIETLANSIASQILANPEVVACRVIVDKPGVPKHARSAAAEVFRASSPH